MACPGVGCCYMDSASSRPHTGVRAREDLGGGQVDLGQAADVAVDDRRERAVALLQAFRLYRAAEVAMRRRTREAMSMGENDLLVLRYLLRAQREGRRVSPSELTRYLGVSTASMTAIIDRLNGPDRIG